MARLNGERRRIGALIRAIQIKSGGPDLSKLDHDQRRVFDDWKSARTALAASFAEPEDYYSEYANGSLNLRHLRFDVKTSLFGECPHIHATDTEQMAAEKYHKFKDR